MKALRIFLVIIFFGTRSAGLAEESPKDIVCEGSYRGHLQGIAHDGNFFYWSHTVSLVKTDQQGQALIQVEVPSHHGDLTVVEDELYVAVELGVFNQPAGQSKPWIYLYDSDTLSLKRRKSVPQLVHGCGGIAYHEGRFLLVGGLPPTHQENYLFEYDKDLNFIRKHSLPTGYTRLGVQTIDYVDNHWWLGCYGSPDNPGVLKVNAAFELVSYATTDFSYGVAVASGGAHVLQGHCFHDRTRGKLSLQAISSIPFQAFSNP